MDNFVCPDKSKMSKSPNKNWAMGKFYELRNFMNAWSQEQQEQEQELHESFANRLYECKPVKIQDLHGANLGLA